MIELSCNEIEQRRISVPAPNRPHAGYMETKVIWLSADVMILNNNDVPINEDIAVALELIPELIRQARIDRYVDECSAWMRNRTTR